jgi:hypothetical protein
MEDSQELDFGTWSSVIRGGAANPNPTARNALVLAESQRRFLFATDRILHELAETSGAQIIPPLLVNVVANLRTLSRIDAFQDLVDFQQVVAIVPILVLVERIHDRFDFQPYDVAQIILVIDRAFAAVARVVNHGLAFDEEK